jgi:hypothetical protein
MKETEMFEIDAEEYAEAVREAMLEGGAGAGEANRGAGRAYVDMIVRMEQQK